ncbi:hypothetical protein FRB94_003397 [Tulasnella sp. JGI-2019a]|nr:hypothetical protein FRB93_004124 [Tulasnella sp. JGI-2019a]KAG9003084.1 hypothetical protein FRB94_003397 [Tulasnella sp. JGI-2019a]
MAHHEEGLAHKLRSLLPLSRQATFQIRLTIHDVTNIPFVQGSFALRWKFRSAKGGGSGVSSRPSLSRTTTLLQPTATQTSRGRGDDVAAASDADSIQHNGTSKPPYTSAEKGKGKAASFSDDVDENGILADSMISSTTGSLSPGGESLRAETPNGTSVSNGSSTPTIGRSTHLSEKGCTPYTPLKDHAVVWEETVEVRTDIKIRKETGDLQPCELKLELRERSVRPSAHVGTPDPIAITRFGSLDLNLAEYADLGPVTRRYLLRESNTNATLKLTIEATRIGGEKVYNVPPLQKGQEVAGVAGVLASDHLKPMLNLYNNSSQPLLRSSTPNGLLPSSRPHISLSKTSIRGSQRSLGNFVTDNAQQTAGNIIEAMFNPWPTSSTTPSPFTIFIPSHNAAASTSASASVSGTNSIRPSTAETQLTQGEDAESLAISHSDMESSVEHHGVNGKPPSKLTATQTSAASGTPRVGWWQRLGGSHTNLTKIRPSTPPIVVVPVMAGIRNTGRKSTDSGVSGVSGISASLSVPSRRRMSSTRGDTSWTDVGDYSRLSTPNA